MYMYTWVSGVIFCYIIYFSLSYDLAFCRNSNILLCGILLAKFYFMNFFWQSWLSKGKNFQFSLPPVPHIYFELRVILICIFCCHIFVLESVQFYVLGLWLVPFIMVVPPSEHVISWGFFCVILNFFYDMHF